MLWGIVFHMHNLFNIKNILQRWNFYPQFSSFFSFLDHLLAFSGNFIDVTIAY